MMLFKFIFNFHLFVFWLLFLEGLTGRLDDLLSKFQQNDYVVNFERTELVRFNKDFYRFFKLTTSKYNRTCPVVNATWELLTDIGNGMQSIIQGYKFASNEYRIFPAVRFEVNFCKAVEANMAGLGEFWKCGNFSGCPQRKGTFHVCNWGGNLTQLPPLIPNGQYMMEMQSLSYFTELFVLRAYGSVSRPIPYKK